MLLEHLRIQAFRGIRDRIEIPLDAPITILLAANGTAKTSVCDAVEWLFTGRVRRLQPGLISAESLQNRYANGTALEVQATAKWAGTTHEIERTEAESVQIPNLHNRRSMTNGKFLEHFTPQYVGQTARSRNVEEPRAEWLRAVRFFSPDGLTLLLDDADDAERVRGIAFAQLLGVGPVGRQIEGLRGVRAQIDSPRSEITRVVEKIAALENQLKAEQASAAGPYLTRVDTVLREVAAFCKLTLPENLRARREVLLSLRDRLAAFERGLESQRAAYTRVKASFPDYQTARDAWKKWSEEQKSALEKAILEAQRQRDDASRQLRALTNASAELATKLGEANTLLGQAQSAIAAVRLEASSQDSSGDLRSVEVRSERDEAAKNAQKAHAQFELVKGFAEEFPGRQRAFLEIEVLEKQRLELSQSIPSVEDQEGVERRLRETKLALTQLRQEISASTDRWQRWGSEVKAQALNWALMSSCPLCGHDYESPEQLRAAIDEVLSRQPSANPETATRLAQLDSAKTEFETSAATIAERRRQLLGLEQRIASQKSACARFVAVAQESGFDEHVFTREDASELIANRRRSVEETAAAAQRLAGDLHTRADLVSRWHAQLQTAGDRLRAVLPAQPTAPEPLPSDPSLEQRLQNVEELLARAQAHAATLQAQAVPSNRAIEEMRSKLPALEATLRQAQEAIQPYARSADNARALMGVIEESWHEVSTDPLDSVSLERIADAHQRRLGELREQVGRLTQTDQNLSQAEQAMREEAQRSEASKTITALRTDHAALLRVDLLRTKLDAAIEQEEQRLNQLMSTQIRPLLRSISSFYVRTQAVPFVDSIGVDPNRNVLRWLGQLADAKPLAAVEMSQGQRQDLALSIFLARARKEQGTFILDEPLAHLDDLNRVAFFDTLRAMVADAKSEAQPFRLVITTASWALVRHLRAKFFHVRQSGGANALRVLELVGNPRNGVEVRPQQ